MMKFPQVNTHFCRKTEIVKYNQQSRMKLIEEYVEFLEDKSFILIPKPPTTAGLFVI